MSFSGDFYNYVITLEMNFKYTLNILYSSLDQIKDKSARNILIDEVINYIERIRKVSHNPDDYNDWNRWIENIKQLKEN